MRRALNNERENKLLTLREEINHNLNESNNNVFQ